MSNGLLEENEGVSAKVGFSDCGMIVTKNFKAKSCGNHPVLDYQNEAAVLQVLDHYRRDIPFQVPKLTEHGLYKDREDKDSPIAYIKMSKLENSNINFDSDIAVPNSVWKEQTKHSARAVASLHSLRLSQEHKELLVRDPMKLQAEWLQTKPNAAKSEYEINRVVSEMLNMEGEHVFIHNDFGLHNICAEGIGSTVDGMFDFCFSGLGVRELEFRSFMGSSTIESTFIDEYQKASGVKLNERNLDVMRAYGAVSKKLWVDRECDNALEKLDGYDAGNNLSQPLRRQLPLDFINN